ncbi:aryl-sulfate sulfotransferase [Halococcus sp. AFM35]|uniref:aryl-sulfate sulfotransferase n=1 Tax=Halococcus sp. AFM35 TaxID=3421653 RepID=UPI003EBE1619
MERTAIMKTIRNRLSRQWVARGVVLVVIVALLVPGIVSAFTNEPTELRAGNVTEPANGTTVISVQGFKVSGQSSQKKPARLVGVGPRGNTRWVYNGSNNGIRWFYDVDPLDNGTLLLTGAKPGKTVVAEWNPKTKTTVWSRTFDWEDTHDVDLINGDQLLVGNMRNYNETSGRNNDRILVYDLSQDEIVWQWLFRERYPESGGGKYTGDWSHVNDVDKIGPGQYMASPRNFDQVIVVNRTSKNISMRLGEDDNYDTLYEQHNPQYLEGDNGTPTMLVADSENDRIVEYAKRNESWKRTWTLTGDFQWPRDADRLPGGNTLVTDTLNNRVMEVTPTGKVVWEYYAPWAPYDAERIAYGDEAGGPTISEQNATGNYTLSGSASLAPGTGGQLTFAEWLTNAFVDTPIQNEIEWLAERWAHATPWIRPVWMGSWEFVGVVLAGVLTLGWVTIEGVGHRQQIRAKGRQFLAIFQT